MITGLCSQTFAVGNEERQCEHRAKFICFICEAAICTTCDKGAGPYNHICPQCAEEENQ